MKLKKNEKRKWLLWLAAAYLLAVAFRYILGVLTSQAPFVMPDEVLYANLARSIANGGGIALRNQPVTYTNLLYPLLISPIYSIFGAGSQFRAIQFFNSFAMNLSIFPAYGIARRLSLKPKTAFGIAVIAILMPDMLLTTRIMTEAIVYPLFMLAVFLMFSKFNDKAIMPWKAALTGLSVFMLTQAKSGAIAIAAVFFILLIYSYIRSKKRTDLYYLLIFAGAYIIMTLFTRLSLQWSGMDFSAQTIYQTQTQTPTLDHLKKTLPGLLLYAFFIPVAFGIYPLFLPAANIRLLGEQRKKQLILILAALVLYAAGACYMFFDTETIGSYFQGRIHLRYVFMFLPVLLCFAALPEFEGIKPNGKLLAMLGFLLAMIVSVSFSALLSNRQYPVDAILLSYIIFDDAALDWRTLSQIAAVTYSIVMLILIYRRGWTKRVKQICIGILIAGLMVANVFGYDLNRHNNDASLSADSGQAAQMLEGSETLLVSSSGLYFDNELSVLDTAMKNAPYFMEYDDFCAGLGSYGTLTGTMPPQYWTEIPANSVSNCSQIVLPPSIFSHMLVADNATVEYTSNGLYAVVTLSPQSQLFHSALAGVDNNGNLKENPVLYIYDKNKLSKDHMRVYLNISSPSPSGLTLMVNGEQFNYELDSSIEWIYADINVPANSTVIKIYIHADYGKPFVWTYSID